MGIVDGLLWPVVAAALIGLVAFAIREPRKYKKIANGLFFLGAAATTGSVIGIGAYERGVAAVSKHIANGGTPGSFESPFPMSVFLPMALYFVWALFVFGLESLGKYLASEDDSKPLR